MDISKPRGYDFLSNGQTDPISKYVDSNETLVRTDPIIGIVLTFLKNKLFSDGIDFMRGGKRAIVPEDFGTAVTHYWIPFVHKALEFMMARGYLVFTIYTNDKKINIPFVPDYEQLVVENKYDDKNIPVVLARWKNEKDTRLLYVYNNQSPFGVTPNNNMSPVDRVKPFLRQWYQLAENDSVARAYNSRPPLALQYPRSMAASHLSGGSPTSYEEELERVIILSMKTSGVDRQNVERIRKLASYDGRTFKRSNIEGRKTWYERAEARQDDGPENRFLYIPHGLEFVSTPEAYVDPAMTANQTAIMENIFNSFGIPYSAILTSSSRTSSTGIDLHKTTLLSTLKIWTSIFHILLTDVYRIIYNVRTGVTEAGASKKTDEKNPDEKETADKELPKKDGYESTTITVHLTSSRMTSPEIAFNLYHQGVVSWIEFKNLMVQSVGLPVSLVDITSPEPIRQQAQTMAQFKKMNEMTTAKTGTTTETDATKKRQSDQLENSGLSDDDIDEDDKDENAKNKRKKM